jgi:ABC-type Mn2+/Zn2+ transport system ATPase subunit
MRQRRRADTEAVEKLGEAVETWEVSAAAVAELLVTGMEEQRVVVAKAAAVDSEATAMW